MGTFASSLISTTIGVLSLTASSAWAETGRVLVTGDSVTRRTGLCGSADTYASCNSAGLIPHETSYASMIAPASSYDYLVKYSSGRGGDTCTTQAAFESGPFVGLNRGLLLRLQSTVIGPAISQNANIVSVLIGINDVNVYGVPEPVVIQCIKSVWMQLRSSGFLIRAMTYPPISAGNTVFLDPAGSKSRAEALNRAIRQAVAEFGVDVQSGVVKLVDGELAYSVGTLSQFTETDGVHTNAQGAAKLAKVWVQTP
jgi:lysophospholipase L1-like esterase